MMPAHLEFIPQRELRAGITCEWEQQYTDYDGTRAYASCPYVASVWLVYNDGDEDLAANFCRPHANLVLTEERKGGWL